MDEGSPTATRNGQAGFNHDEPAAARVDPPTAKEQNGDISESTVGNGPVARPAFRLIPSFDETELGVVTQFYAPRRDDFRYVFEETKFLVWNGTFWERDATGIIRRAFSEDLGRRVRADLSEVETNKDLEEEERESLRSRLRKWLSWVESERGIRDGLRLFASFPGITIRETDLDARPTLLTLQNGTLDLVSGKLRKPAREDLITRVLPFEFDPHAWPHRFLEFLEKVQPDPRIREYLQRAAGRCLIRNVERRQLLVFYGVGANGKSVFLNAIGSVVEPYLVTADVSTLLEKKFDRIENDLARMAPARMVVVRELPAGRRFDESLIKSLTGGDRITARFLRCEYFDYDPGFLMFVSTNHHPILSDSPAMTDRVVMVPWSVRIPPEEQDRGLAAKLLRERPGILNWMLPGYRNWRQSGLVPPTEVAKFTAMVGEEGAPFSQFVEDVLQRDEAASGRFVPTDWIFAAYGAWAKRAGRIPLDRGWVGRSLGDAGLDAGRFGHGNVRGYGGWSIRPDWTPHVRKYLETAGKPFVEADLQLGSVSLVRKREGDDGLLV